MSALADVYSEVFGTVFAFRAAREEERPGYRPFRGHVMSLLADTRRRAEDERLDPRGYAQYAVVALLDEAVLASDWAEADQWRREPLQIHYFRNSLAGEQFFDRLDELRPGTDDDLLEVYFLCLCAGFRGRYFDDPGELTSRRRKLHHDLRRTDLRDEKHLAEEAYGRNLERSLVRSHFPVWWLVPFVVGAIALYVTFYVVLGEQVGTIVRLAG